MWYRFLDWFSGLFSGYSGLLPTLFGPGSEIPQTQRLRSPLVRIVSYSSLSFYHWSMLEYSHACFAYYQGSCLSNFFLHNVFHFIRPSTPTPKSLLSHKVTWNVTNKSDLFIAMWSMTGVSLCLNSAVHWTFTVKYHYLRRCSIHLYLKTKKAVS